MIGHNVIQTGYKLVVKTLIWQYAYYIAGNNMNIYVLMEVFHSVYK